MTAAQPGDSARRRLAAHEACSEIAWCRLAGSFFIGTADPCVATLTAENTTLRARLEAVEALIEAEREHHTAIWITDLRAALAPRPPDQHDGGAL